MAERVRYWGPDDNGEQACTRCHQPVQIVALPGHVNSWCACTLRTFVQPKAPPILIQLRTVPIAKLIAAVAIRRTVRDPRQSPADALDALWR
jgi:hypothetical protein